jgi:uncharacterized membrane protein YjdF
MMPKNLEEFLERAQLWLAWALRLSLVVAIVINALNQQWMVVFLTTVALVLSFLPAIIEKNSRIVLPIELESCIVVFVYCTVFLGEVSGYYHKYWWWDIALHSMSALVLGFVGFLMAYILYTKKLIQAKPFLVVLFAFCFAVSIGAVWEVYEYLMDNAFDLNMQKEGLSDTMEDLICDCTGALVIATVGYFYLKFHHGLMFKDWVVNFVQANPRLFRKKSRTQK